MRTNLVAEKASYLRARMTPNTQPPMAPPPTTLSHRPARARPRHSTALILIDQRPLQRETWAEFHRAQKLQDKAARDLHRHEIVDTPAFERWLHAAFPTLVTSTRELHARVASLTREVESAQYMASLTGRSLKKIWRELKEYQTDPEAFERKAAEAEAQAGSARRAFFPDDDHHRHEGEDEDTGFDAEEFARSSLPARSAPGDTAARDLYRRLVQRLHPDRGGEWTPARERLWHEVQQAWAARDTDWLARLDIEWETAHDVINEHSSIARLCEAIRELHAAHRDTERKLRAYRQTPSGASPFPRKSAPPFTGASRRTCVTTSTLSNAAWTTCKKPPPPGRRPSAPENPPAVPGTPSPSPDPPPQPRPSICTANKSHSTARTRWNHPYPPPPSPNDDRSFGQDL